jgi:hypothetical protein
MPLKHIMLLPRLASGQRRKKATASAVFPFCFIQSQQVAEGN